jgi:hypothetical protein
MELGSDLFEHHLDGGSESSDTQDFGKAYKIAGVGLREESNLHWEGPL